MKIWLNTSPHFESRANDCTAPSILPVYVMESSMGEETPAWWASTLVHVPSLYVQSCSAERWLVCDPTGLGRLAVFDAQAMSLFSLFETPTTISQATRMMIHWPQESIEEAVTLFYRLGFLRDSTKPAPVLEKEASEVLTAWLHVTNDCNLRCHYCYIHKSKEDMTSEVGYRAINAIFRSASKHEYKTVRLKYAGGEASLRIRRVIELRRDYHTLLSFRIFAR